MVIQCDIGSAVPPSRLYRARPQIMSKGCCLLEIIGIRIGVNKVSCFHELYYSL